ncbi:MAG: hypothetical protein H8E51_07050 [Bacteroidetes bacterium]|nr:hypothetical protein [Bacteroidota bacterium]
MFKWYNEFAMIGDHVINGTPLDPQIKGNIIIDPPRKPKIVLDKTGKIVELFISQSLIKQFYRHYSETLVPEVIHQIELLPCPWRIYQAELLALFKMQPTEAMMKGRYFETLCIGAGADGEAIYDLQRKSNGDMKIDQIRIKQAVKRFHVVCKTTDIILLEDGGNLQYYHKVKWIDPDYPDAHSDIIIWIEATADIISQFHHGEWKFPSAVIDLKLTGNIKSKFGKFCWGSPEDMDHLQGILYAWLFGMPFIYLVFDYPATNPGYKIYPLNTDIDNSDPVSCVIAKERRRSLLQAIRGTINQILLEELHGWPKKKSSQCDYCPVTTCEHHRKPRMV